MVSDSAWAHFPLLGGGQGQETLHWSSLGQMPPRPLLPPPPALGSPLMQPCLALAGTVVPHEFGLCEGMNDSSLSPRPQAPRPQPQSGLAPILTQKGETVPTFWMGLEPQREWMVG